MKTFQLRAIKSVSDGTFSWLVQSLEDIQVFVILIKITREKKLSAAAALRLFVNLMFFTSGDFFERRKIVVNLFSTVSCYLCGENLRLLWLAAIAQVIWIFWWNFDAFVATVKTFRVSVNRKFRFWITFTCRNEINDFLMLQHRKFSQETRMKTGSAYTRLDAAFRFIKTKTLFHSRNNQFIVLITHILRSLQRICIQQAPVYLSVSCSDVLNMVISTVHRLIRHWEAVIKYSLP